MVLAAAFAWGLSEAIFFFFVPDVLLTFVAIKDYRIALRATGAALVGALIGGALMYAWGLNAEPLLLHIPGIHAPLVDTVRAQLHDHGIAAMLFGPLRGTPYKIYAVEWGGNHGGLGVFLLVSIPARYIRFFLGVVVCAALRRVATPRRLAIFWVAFYVWYFWRFGW